MTAVAKKKALLFMPQSRDGGNLRGRKPWPRRRADVGLSKLLLPYMDNITLKGVVA
jgi:hypothetical protein